MGEMRPGLVPHATCPDKVLGRQVPGAAWTWAKAPEMERVLCEIATQGYRKHADGKRSEVEMPRQDALCVGVWAPPHTLSRLSDMVTSSLLQCPWQGASLYKTTPNTASNSAIPSTADATAWPWN